MPAKRFPRAIGALPELVAFVREFFAARRLDADHAFDLDLVLEELFTNMVRHGRGGTTEIEVGLEADGALLTLRLRDEGVEPWDPPPPDRGDRPGEERPGGRGIAIVRELTRELRFEHRDGTTTVTAVLEIPR
jgi:anti-sigma regulatory factor (Ser/Thr protein kinase)